MDSSTVIELRQYTLHPGRRETLIALFEEKLVPQLAAGMRLLGQFRDLDHADRFVWLRGFSDMPARTRALRERVREERVPCTPGARGRACIRVVFPVRERARP